MSTSADNSPDEAQPRVDPTQTTTVRDRFRQRLSARTREVRGAVRQQIEGTQPSSATAAEIAAGGVAGLAVIETLGAFRRWLSRLFESLVVGTAALTNVRRGTHWTASFVRESYETGLRQAHSALRARGYDAPDRAPRTVMGETRHQQALGDLYEQTYIDLEDAVENTQQEVRRAITDGGFIERAADDVAKRELVDTINDRVSANMGKRFQPLAASAPVRSANEAAIQSYAAAGVEEVGIEPETTTGDGQDVDWITADDDRVCLECKQLAVDAPYKLAAVIAGDAPRPIRDSHLVCRCFLLPL